jgi:hypothetical protein
MVVFYLWLLVFWWWTCWQRNYQYILSLGLLCVKHISMLLIRSDKFSLFIYPGWLKWNWMPSPNKLHSTTLSRDRFYIRINAHLIFPTPPTKGLRCLLCRPSLRHGKVTHNLAIIEIVTFPWHNESMRRRQGPSLETSNFSLYFSGSCIPTSESFNTTVLLYHSSDLCTAVYHCIFLFKDYRFLSRSIYIKTVQGK